MRIAFLLGAIFVAAAFLPYPNWLTSWLGCSSDKPTLQILMIGNSFTFGHDLPLILEQMLKRSGHPVEIEVLAPPGQYLDWHADNPATLAALKSRPWNIVILQDCSKCPLEYNDYFDRGVRRMVALVKSVGASPKLFITWADKGGLSDQQIITTQYKRLGTELGVAVVPVGQAWATLQVTRPSVNLYDTDQHHAGTLGALLTAYVFALNLYPEMTTTLTDLRRSPTYLYQALLGRNELLSDPKTSDLLLQTARAVAVEN